MFLPNEIDGCGLGFDVLTIDVHTTGPVSCSREMLKLVGGTDFVSVASMIKSNHGSYASSNVIDFTTIFYPSSSSSSLEQSSALIVYPVQKELIFDGSPMTQLPA